MAVTSTTLAGVNVWQLSGAVTDAELKTAWSGLITNNRYVLGRTLYVDSTCSLVNVRGTYYIDAQNLGVILHLSRNKANTLFRNWFFTQTVGLAVGARSNFVRFTNGSTITNSLTDGIDMQGGGMMYAVVGNPGGGDPRYLNEMMFGSLDGTLVTSAAWTEQEIEPTSIGTIWRGLNIQKAAGYPILAATGGTQRHVIYRSNFNTEGATLRLIRPYYNNSICYVSSVIRRQGAAVTANLMDTFGSNGSAVIMALNNWTDESWFGASKTNLTGANWNAGNRVIGGVMKKIQVQPSTLIRTYDSRSTTVSQKSTFSETTSDFLTGTDSTTSDAVTGRAQIVCVGAIATGSTIAITRYTGQRFTLQKFGFRVQVETPDMTFGDDDLSAFSPITMTTQDGIARTQAAINAATTITSFQDLLEELHVLAIGLSGSASYAGAYTGNLFTFLGGTLTTAFAAVVVDATAAAKIAFNSTTNTLTIKATTLVGNSTVQIWSNATGTVTLQNGAKIEGIYASSAGTSTSLELRDIKPGAAYIVANNATKATILFGTNGTASAQDYQVYFPPGSAGTAVYVARQGYGDQFDFEVITLVAGAMWYQFTDIPDEGITQSTLATVQAYTTLENTSKLYDYIAAYRMTEAGIKLGNIVVRAGTQLQFGNYSGVVNHNPASGLVFEITGSTITLKASALDGTTRYDTIVATPPATWVGHTNEEINCEVEDANGDSSVNIQAAAISTFEIWKITDATPPDDYATGTLLDTVGIGKYRFLHADGYKMVIRDTTTNFRVVSEMEKGTYTAELFFGASVQLAQAAEVSEINNKVDALQIDVTNLPSAVWAFIVETGHSALSTMRLMASVLVGKVSGAGTGTETFRDLNDTKDRVISSVDVNGNRTNVTKDGT